MKRIARAVPEDCISSTDVCLSQDGAIIAYYNPEQEDVYILYSFKSHNEGYSRFCRPTEANPLGGFRWISEAIEAAINEGQEVYYFEDMKEYVSWLVTLYKK